MSKILIAAVAVATVLTFAVNDAEAFGGRGYARRHARHAYHHHHRAPVVVQRAYVAPVATYYRAPAYYRPPVSVHVGRYNSYYGYPAYRRGVSIGIGW